MILVVQKCGVLVTTEGKRLLARALVSALARHRCRERLSDWQTCLRCLPLVTNLVIRILQIFVGQVVVRLVTSYLEFLVDDRRVFGLKSLERSDRRSHWDDFAGLTEGRLRARGVALKADMALTWWAWRLSGLLICCCKHTKTR